MRKRESGKRIGWLIIALCVCLGLCPAASASGVETDEDGGIWDYDRGIYTDPTGATYQINEGGTEETTADSSSTSSASSTQKNADGSITIDSGETDSVLNEDGSMIVENGQVFYIEPEETRAPLTAEEWEERLRHAAEANGTETPTVYKDPATGQLTLVEVKYIGIGRSMIVLNGEETLVNTVDLEWQTTAPEDKVLAVINTPKNGYAAMYAGKSKKTTLIKQCRLDSVVRVLGTGKTWTFVDHEGTRGYVLTGSLEFFRNDHIDFLPGYVSLKGKIKGKNTANIRSRDATHRILADYRLGTPVTVFDIVDEWAEIDICGWHCRINSKYVTLEKELASAD